MPFSGMKYFYLFGMWRELTYAYHETELGASMHVANALERAATTSFKQMFSVAPA
jgi:hypothetical protein